MTKHTPTPYRSERTLTGDIGIRADKHGYVAVVGLAGTTQEFGERQQANADFIIRACNAHDDLVIACNGLMAAISDLERTEGRHYAGPGSRLGHCVARAGAALAKATPQKNPESP